MTDHDETTRLFDEEAVRKAFGHPDWPRGTEVVVYARKQFAVNKTAQKVAYNPAQQAAEPAEGGGTEGGGSTDPNE